MSFKQIIGQRLAVELIRRAIEEKRLAHAYLFIGPDGVGKALLAKIFAQSLNCERGEADPCGECISCKKIENKNHPDVGWIYPEGKSRKIRINSIRQVSQALSLKPYEGKAKVFIIDEADHMTEEAANCLLKTLEEPPKDSTLILLASNISRLYPTIISRCQKIPFYPLDEEMVKAELVRKYKIDEKRATYISRFSEGRLGKAAEALEEEALIKRDKVVDEFILPKDSGYEDIWLYEEPREKVNDTLNTLAIYFRDLLVFVLSRDINLLVNFDKADEIIRRSKKYSVERLEEIIENIITTQDLIRSNANIKIALSFMRLNII
ncbi:MAG: hypothetical protein AMJ78_09635 [Omnitrophica WOR_2 bacterium SM23_29]|nr:MAG: hypothetical protein AMJ78_09635 [Omnitrophica WOR_2 bacterium SM23_29]